MTCEELRGHYELYALGVAAQPERDEICAHLERRCAECAGGVQHALGLIAAVCASAPAATPPARLRKRLLAAAGIPERRYGWPVFWAAVALLCLSAAMYFSGRERQYAEESLRLRSQLGGQTTELRRWRQAFAILSAPDTTEAAFDQGQAGGRIFVNPSLGVMLVAARLRPAPAGLTYEMWIVSKSGEPRPAGRFQSRDDETAMHIQPGPVDVAAVASVLVTQEDAGGAPHPAAKPVISIVLPAPARRPSPSELPGAVKLSR